MESRKMVLLNMVTGQEERHGDRHREQTFDTAGGRRGWEELREVTFYHLLFLYRGEFELKWMSQVYKASVAVTALIAPATFRFNAISFHGSVMQRTPFCHPLAAS